MTLLALLEAGCFGQHLGAHVLRMSADRAPKHESITAVSSITKRQTYCMVVLTPKQLGMDTNKCGQHY